MRKLGLRAVRPKRNTSKRASEHKVYPYLLRGKTIDSRTRCGPLTLTSGEDEPEASLGSATSPSFGFPRDVGVIVENDFDRGCDGIGGVEGLQKLDEFATAVTILL